MCFGQKMCSPISTAATSIRADKPRSRKNGGHSSPAQVETCAADDRETHVTGKGLLDFYLSVVPFSEEVREMNTLSDRFLVEMQFWIKRKTQLDLKENRASILYGDGPIYGSLVLSSPKRAEDKFEAVQAFIENSEVADSNLEMELSQF